MREILFKGKTLLGKWIEGDLIQYLGWGKVHIAQNHKGAGGQEVIPETVGQYTGLTDKNGTKIFEGDIVKRHWFDRDSIYRIDYDNGLAAFIGQRDASYTTFDYDAAEFEVIGNIYENPELLRSDIE